MLFQAPFTCDCWTTDHKSFTPDGKSLATVLNDFKVEIRDSSTGNLTSTLRCIDKVDLIKWSPNGRHIVTCMYERNAVHVFTPPTHPTQASARIDGGELGVEYVMWTPNSQALIVFGKQGIRADVWELRTSKLYGLLAVKDSRHGAAFSPNKRVFAYLTRKDEKDVLSLHSVDDWHIINQIPLDTLDARHLVWSPDGVSVAISDCEIEHRVVIVNTESGVATSYSGYQGQLGALKLCWCMNSHLLAVGSGNDTIHVLFMPDWKLLTELDHVRLTRIEKADHYEEESPGKFVSGKFPLTGFDPNLAGVSNIEWSRSGKYIASTVRCHARSLFIWDVESLTLIHAFTFLTPIADFKWSPTNDDLAVAIGTDKLLNWRPSGFRISHAQEAAIQIHMIEWRSDGECLAAFDNAAGTCTLAFTIEEENE